MINMNKIIKDIEKEYMKKKISDFKVGDTVRVFVKITEGDKERIQPFEGIVISKKGEGVRKNFTVRRIFQGIGVERIFLLHSPKIENIKVIRPGKVRRAKLYYLRKRIGTQATKVEESK